MGLNALPDICRQLIAHGAAPSHPIAVVQQGTIAAQKVLTGTLADLPAQVARHGLSSPCLIIVGEVVLLHRALAWFKPQPQQQQQAGPARSPSVLSA